MEDYVIITDSTSDLPSDLIEKYSIVVIPMVFTVAEKEYKNYPDGREINFPDFYNLVRAGHPAATAQITAHDFTEIFEPYLMNGQNILYIAFSSALSGTYNSSAIASADLLEKYPDRKIFAVDSLSASMGEGLLVYLGALEKEKGKSIEEVHDWLEKNKLKLCHWFTVDDLNHLKRGGRVSATTAFIGTMLGIKPILHVDDLGRLIPVGKTRGRNQSLEFLVQKMAETSINPENQTIFISHGDSLQDAKKVEDLVREKLHVKDVYINFIGPVIGAHSGPGTIALFFLGSKR